MKNRLLLAVLLLVFSFTSFSQPLNNLCGNAIPVTVGPTCSNFPGSLYNATNTVVTGSCTNNRDVWYTFQVPAGSHSVSIKTTITSATPTLTPTNTSVELFNANSGCPTGASLTCANISLPKLYSNLTPGNTYMLRVYTSAVTSGASDAYDFNVCVTSNDEPANALALTQGILVDGNLFGAGAAPGIPLSSCTGTPDDDLYYQFVATSSTATIAIVSTGSSLPPANVGTQLFSGPATSLVSIACGNTRLDATGLTTGNTYFIRVYSLSASPQSGAANTWAFKIGIMPSANDDISNAVSLVRGAAAIDGNLLSATATPGIPVDCATGNPDDDVYYKFVATNEYAAIQVTTSGSDLNASGVRTQMFSGSIGSFTTIACGTSAVQASGLTPGTTYYCRVYSNGAGQSGLNWNFKIAWINAANDEPASPPIIPTGGGVNSSVLGAEPTAGIPVGCATGTPDDDVYFQFVATSEYASFQAASIGNELNTSGVRMQLFSGTPGSLNSLTCGTTRLAATGLVVGNTYYIRVYSAGTVRTGSGWNFRINWVIPTNDNPSTTPPLVYANYLTSSLIGTEPTTGVPVACATGNPDDDIYFQFTANSPYASFTITNAGIELLASGIRTQIFAGPVGSFTSLACGNSRTEVTGLTVGIIYYLRVYSAGTGQTGAGWGFRVNWLANPVNDDPSNAIDIAAGSTITGDLIAAGLSTGIPIGCAATAPDDDVYYKFTATYSYATLTVSAPSADLVAGGIRMQVFSGAIGSFTSLACGSTTVNLTGLTPGTTYYCRVYTAATSQTGMIYTFRLSLNPSAPTAITGGRMREVFSQQILSAPNVLADPWEVTYGPDANLWVTESKGYKVYKINTQTGVRDTILDISQFSTTSPDNTFNCQFNNGSGAQGGLAGLALHPKFLAAVGAKNYVYVAYVHSQVSSNVFVNRVVRFTYNTSTNKLEAPVSVCDTLPGSNDHNSQRMIIAPVGGVDYLFYAEGDMGSGQFGNSLRIQHAQNIFSYEGKILRFNLEPDGDAGALDQWIPSTGAGDATNPYNAVVGKQHAVWAIGIRNNQGLVYDPILNKLYGSSHGPFSDDEINVIERGKNYGHPIVIGYADGNANGTTAGASPGMNPAYPGSCPDIIDEVATAAALPDYKDPLFSAYPNSPAFPTLKGLWDQIPVSGNGQWPSEGWSGLDMYSHKVIPGWKRSLIASSLKWGRLVRLRLDAAGNQTAPTNTAADTVSYFGSTNRFRDLAFAPNGKDIFVIMDRSTSTSGPSAMFPVVPACQGCLQKYTFLGYHDNGGQSTLPAAIDVTEGTLNTCNTGTTVNIDNTNNTYWVPITGPDGNIMAEINANGQDLGTITSSFYKNAGAIRVKNGVSYADRNITITPQNQPSGTVKVRLYLTKAEYDAFDADPLSGISTVSDLRVHKNDDPCQSAIAGVGSILTPTFATTHGANGYAAQIEVSGFSTFYIGSTNVLLPLSSLNFTGKYQNTNSNLKWETKNESGTNRFELERSVDGSGYTKIAHIDATGSVSDLTRYAYTDEEASRLGVSRLFYRLKVIDNDGAYTYSTVVVIEIPVSFITRISIFPNPADKQTTVLISSPEEQKVTWQLVDLAGRTVISKDVVLKKGENRILINLNNLRSGVYFLQVKGRFVNAQEKIRKL